MLKIRKNVNLSADIKVGEDLVATVTASVDNQSGVKNAYSETIRNAELYRNNRAAVRTDLRAFEDALYALEDEISAEMAAAADTTTTDTTTTDTTTA